MNHCTDICKWSLVDDSQCLHRCRYPNLGIDQLPLHEYYMHGLMSEHLHIENGSRIPSM